MRISLTTRLLAAAICIAAIVPVAVGGTGRYLAVFADGRRISGAELSGWGRMPAVPRLQGADLSDPKRPLKWFQDNKLGLWDRSSCGAGYVEFVGGDRIVGQVVGSERAPRGGIDSGSVYLGVVPARGRELPKGMDRRLVRVSELFVRRIVWGRQPDRAFSPSTAFLQTGGRVKFTSIRWFADGVTLLMENGVRRIRFSQLGELHLAHADSWKSYLRELAILNPSPGESLFRLETTDGMILTSSAKRFRAAAAVDRKQRKKGTPEALPECWYHMVQPAWSADAIWVPFDTIAMRRHFASHRMPLSRLTPDGVVQKSMTGFAWRWQADRNVQGDRMMVAGRFAVGGLGVHAYNELSYALPAAAKAFRTQVAIDASAGSGGCVRGAVYMDSTKSKPLYRSEVIVGSGKLHDSGSLKLPAVRGKARKLILLADPVHTNRPSGADPLDIRDSLNWIDPVLELEPAALTRAIADTVAESVPAWNGWTISVSGKNEIPLCSQWDESNPQLARFVHSLGTGGRRLALTASRAIGPKQRWLKLHVRQVGAAVNPGRIEVRIDNRLAAYLPVRRTGSDRPYLVPIDAFQGKTVKLQIVYRPGRADELIEWPVLALVDRRTEVDWRPMRTVSAYSQRGVKLSVLDDGSILAAPETERLEPLLDTYCIRAVADIPLISAIRLEAIGDPSLPRGGPGRQARAVVSQFRASTGSTRRKVLKGRYVKLSLPGRETYLHVNEVQVFAPPPTEAELISALGGDDVPENVVSENHKAADILAILKTPGAKRDIDQRTVLRSYLDAISRNIAEGCETRQSSRYDSRDNAKNAVDGKVFSGYTHTGRDMSPWLMIDLGATCDIDRIVVWNRQDGNGYERMVDLNVELLDADSNVVWKRVLADSSAPGAELLDSDARELTFSSAATSYHQPGLPAAAVSLESGASGWTISSRIGESHAIEFTLDRPIDIRKTGLDIKLRQAFAFSYAMSRFSDGFDRMHWSNRQRAATLGRFRLLATGDSTSSQVEAPALLIKPFDTAGAEKADALVALASPHALFGDSGTFRAVRSADKSKVRLIADDRHAGKRAVRIESGGEYRLNLGRLISVRSRPVEGEFRYIRFAFRKYGGGRVSLSLGNLSSDRRPCRYEAGDGSPTGPEALSGWSIGLPPEWIVIDRDIFADFGVLDVNSITISCSGGGYAVLDHVYLARAYDDFKRITDAPSVEATNLKARRVLAGPILKKGFAAFVTVKVKDLSAGGVIVGDDGYVMTVGHILVGAGKDASIRLHDGRTVRGTIAGVYRNCNVGLVKITDKGPWKGLELSKADTLKRGSLYVGFSFDRSFKGGKAPTSYITDIADEGYWTYQGKHRMKDAIVGGPLLDCDAKIVGFQNNVLDQGVLQYCRTRSPAHEWRKLLKGEVWSKWLTGSGPMLGYYSAIRHGGCGVAKVYPDTPAATAGMKPGDLITHVDNQQVDSFEAVGKVLAQKDPGQEINIVFKRGNQTIKKKIRLMRRRHYPQ